MGVRPTQLDMVTVWVSEGHVFESHGSQIDYRQYKGVDVVYGVEKSSIVSR
jgi:hypothetical protein